MAGDLFTPRSEDQVCQAVAWAAAHGEPLEIVGGGSKRAYGRATTATAVLDMSAFSGIRLYEPDELVMTAGAATPLSEITTTLAEHGQCLAFEPPDWGALMGAAEAAEPTIGGVLSCNLSGSRRLHSGAARDHFLGFSAINGLAQPFKGGGRVVKNVTGFDLCKAMAGAMGTLAVLTEVTFKVLPRGGSRRTLALSCTDPAVAVAAMTAALSTPYEVSGAAWLPLPENATPAVVIRLEGTAASVDYRQDKLKLLLSGFGEIAELEPDHADALWPVVGAGCGLATPQEHHIWRLMVPASTAPAIAQDLHKHLAAKVAFDWGGALIWVALPPCADAAHQQVRACLGRHGGSATLVRASAEVRARVPVFQPLSPGVELVSANLKAAFDPQAVLNRGRKSEGL